LKNLPWDDFPSFLFEKDLIGNQTVQGPNESFSAASKGDTRRWI